MFSLLGMINSYIGYFNMNATLKGRIYTIVGGVGNFYLLYVAYRFFANGFIGRGSLFILVFLILLYFTYLNVLYFFTPDKTSRFDISPKIEKLLGIKIPDATAQEKAKVAPGFVQTNGIFDQNEFLPSTLKFSAKQRENLKLVVAQLEKIGYLKLDFAGKNDQELFKSSKTGERFYALATPVALPYYELREKKGKLLVYGGVNQIEAVELGEVTQVGLLRGYEALKRYQLSLATVLLAKGPYKFAGRSTMMQKDEPYELQIQIAYREREAHPDFEARLKDEFRQKEQDFEAREKQLEKEHLSRRAKNRNN